MTREQRPGDTEASQPAWSKELDRLRARVERLEALLMRVLMWKDSKPVQTAFHSALIHGVRASTAESMQAQELWAECHAVLAEREGTQ